MIGGQDLSKYLIQFNSAEWAQKANQQLQAALQQGLDYSQNYTQQAVKASQDYDQKAQQQMQQGFNQAQALNAPQRLAGYTALDSYMDSLGLSRPTAGSFQLASALQNQATGAPNNPQQQQVAQAFNQGLLQQVPQQQYQGQ
jgi:glycine/D-amino acid oxidase-like deaminating enzyme